MKFLWFFIFIAFSIPSFGQHCELFDLVFTQRDCNADQQFFVTIDFKHRNNSDCFEINGNGHSYGRFLYSQLPITLGPLEGDCLTEYEFVIRDCQHPDCRIEKLLGKVCCPEPCEIGEIHLEKGECTGDRNFFVFLSFRYQGGSDCVAISGNGKNYGNYSKNQQPIKIGPLKGNCETEYEFLIQDCHDPHCSREVFLGKVCCESECDLFDLSIRKSDCDKNHQFFAYVNFNYTGTSDSFQIRGNGTNYGKFSYDSLPIKLGPLNGDCHTEYEFEIKDSKDPECSIDTIIGKVCCERGDCDINELRWEKTECENGEFYIHLNFDHQNTSDCFIVEGNGHTYGRFTYAQLPIRLGPFKGDCTTEYEFTIRDCVNEHCRAEFVVGKVCCERGDCEINEVRWERTECDNGEFYIHLNFHHQNTSDCFIVEGNGHTYGRFTYAQLPIRLGPFKGDCTTEYEFTIRDCVNEHCRAEFVVGKVCCERGDCEINEVRWERTECDNGEFYVHLNFHHQNTSDCFIVEGNGHTYGRFTYAQLPIRLGPFKGDCTTEYEFTIRDCVNEHCRAEFVVGKVCCERGDCEINEVRWERTECDNGEFYIHLNFHHENTSDCFIVQGNGHTYGRFTYAQLPIRLGPFKGDCTTEYEFTIRDCVNEHCRAEFVVGKVCCERGDCEINEVRWERTECDNGEFYIHLNFHHENTSDCFIVQGNGHTYGRFTYAQLPIRLGPFKGDCTTEYEFTIRDCENEHCRAEFVVGKVCCERGDCEINEVRWERTECDNGEFYIHLNFDHQNTSNCFIVRGNGHTYGRFPYTQLPIRLGPFRGDCTTEYEFTIRDCENEHCRAEFVVGKVCCERGECEINEVRWERTECDNGEFYIHLNFHHQNTSDCFIVQGNGHTYGRFTYAQLPIRLGPFKGDCTTEYEFTIRDCENEHCRAEFVVGKVCCERGECEINEVRWERTECDNGEFYIHLNFHHQNTSDCFIVQGNGHTYGRFTYAQLPIRLGPFKGDCTTEYEFTIRDCENEHCRAEFVVGKVCCERGDCEINEVRWERTECDNGDFYIRLNFHHQNTSDCFIVQGNGHNYGRFRYSQLPIRLGPFKGDCSTEYEFVIRDCENEHCRAEFVVGKVCCEEPGRGISELKISRSDCNADKKFDFIFQFKAVQVSDSFLIRINGAPAKTFAYKDMPVRMGPYIGDCITVYGIRIADQKNPAYVLESKYEKVCCDRAQSDCLISELSVDPIECTGSNQYSLRIDFKYQGTKNVGFDVFDRTGPIGFFPYSSLPLKINDFKRSGSRSDYLKVCENDNPHCCKTIEFKGLDCIKGINNHFDLKKLEVGQRDDKIFIYSEVIFPEYVKVKLFDLQGREVRLDQFKKDLHQIEFSAQTIHSNIYIVRVENDLLITSYKIFILQ